MEIKDLLGDAYKEGMTMEEITAALKDISLPEDKTAEVERLNAALSKSNSEAAEYKRQLRAKLTEDEAQKQKEQEDRDNMQKELAALRRESSVSKNKAKLIGLGYDEALAEETAEAMEDGQLDKVFVNHKKHLDAFEKKIKADILKNTPRPVPDGDGQTITLEALKKMSIAERADFAQNHPEEYQTLYEGEKT